ncbi:serine/threonine-protein kinase [Bacillus sp. T33-2]|uniref:serine/threonine-protein kinase n=1 Tax=Bacillus sp. T33-2 TaxID=2054168 RepID=UPI000C781005|nr:serine/threonine-protein kinase [Bacillus sp. T33-2]PLR92564.1 serine/threonine protein kinase [Bacillus sp. T33-2]
MLEEWQTAVEALSQIEIKANPDNEPVTINGSPDGLCCVGIGTDAAVFRHIHAPNYAFKVYADERISKKDIERDVYERLGTSPYFSKLLGAGERYLVLSFEQGTTLYDCLLQGIHIPKQVIQDVEDARDFVRERGLNPRDIHLKNILLQNGRAKIIDVSEYIKPGNDYRWEHLKKGYEEYYHLIDGRPIPFWLMEAIRKWYNQTNGKFFSFEDFMKKVIKLSMFWRL